MRIADMMVAFPGMVLAIAVAGILGPSITNAVIAVGLVSWTKYARMARSLVLKMKHDDYIEAARVTGSRTGYILTRYMLPTVLPTLIITASTDIGGMMLELAGLSFLGFGATPPTPEWGLMLSEGRAYMQNAPWVMIFPGLAILLAGARIFGAKKLQLCKYGVREGYLLYTLWQSGKIPLPSQLCFT